MTRASLTVLAMLWIATGCAQAHDSDTVTLRGGAWSGAVREGKGDVATCLDPQIRSIDSAWKNLPLCEPTSPKPILSCAPDGSIIISASMQGLFADPKLGTLAWSYVAKACAQRVSEEAR